MCYKIVCVSKLYPWGTQEVIKTPFQDTNIPDDVINGKNYFRAEGNICVIKHGISKTRSIYGGVIHAYRDKDTAKNEAWPRSTGKVVYKCIIPKGTRYMIGVFSDICAKKIKFVERIEY